MIIIYKITNLINGKVYIGQTIRPMEERFERHLRDAKNNLLPDNKFHRAIRKYGEENFQIEKIDEASTKKELNEKEIYWIKYFNSVEKGYNASPGGDGGNTYISRTPSQMQETKKKIGLANKGKKNGMSKQIKCKSVISKKEYFFDCIEDCLKFFNIKNKKLIRDRAIGICNTLWRDEWMFAYVENKYGEYVKSSFDRSTLHGTKTFLQKENECLEFPSKARAFTFLGLDKHSNLPNGTIINGYQIIYSS